ncbi:MAG TPA: hypothetical protein VN841_08940 [Bryobacteraceae bacterium]|nr:hypothetical protein [Bryobacteraceae bacterium]
MIALGGMAGVSPKKHDHGQLYRAKMVPYVGPTQYGEWFGTESDLRASMRGQARAIGTRYYCETKMIGCAECETGDRAKVICTL